MNLSDKEKQEIKDALAKNKPLDEKYRFRLFEKRKVELTWLGKTDYVTNVSLPFQHIEYIDEPRREKRGSLQDVGISTADKRTDWTNKLIWGDNKLILGSLKNGPLREEIKEQGGIKLIYIDPPFDVGADFSTKIEVGDNEEFEKQATAIEEVAYRDTWGEGADSFIAMMYERLSLMKDLLAEDGSIYVHCDYRVNSYLRLILDEIFGKDNFRNEISWRRQIPRGRKVEAEFMAFSTDYIFLYTKGENATWNKIPKINYITIEEAERKYMRDEKGFFRTSDPGSYSNESLLRLYEQGRIYVTHGGEVTIHENIIGTTKGNIAIKYYREQINNKVKEETVADNMWNDISGMGIVSHEYIGYPTQKPEKLLERVIKASSNKGDLIADFFCGSGTTLAVAEKLGRKWIGSDLGRFGIHTTRKRMIDIQRQLNQEGKEFRAFEILNLGEYERAHFAGITIDPNNEQGKALQEKKEKDTIKMIIEAYHAQPVENLKMFQCKKDDRIVAIGPVTVPVTRDFIEEVIEEAQEKKFTKVDVLGFEFDMGLLPQIIDTAKEKGIELQIKYIPRDVFDKKAVERNQVVFYNAAYIEAEVKKDGNEVTVTLKDFASDYTQEKKKQLEKLGTGKQAIVIRNGQVLKITKLADGED